MAAKKCDKDGCEDRAKLPVRGKVYCPPHFNARIDEIEEDEGPEWFSHGPDNPRK